jgi:hypothetical protein
MHGLQVPPNKIYIWERGSVLYKTVHVVHGNNYT